MRRIGVGQKRNAGRKSFRIGSALFGSDEMGITLLVASNYIWQGQVKVGGLLLYYSTRNDSRGFLKHRLNSLPGQE